MRSGGIAAMARLMASTCSSTIWRKRSSESRRKKRARSMARSGQSSCSSEPARVDQLVLLPHLASQRGDVLLVRAVVGGEQDGGDHSRRGRGHEPLREAARPSVGLGDELLDLAHRGSQVRVLDLRDRLRGVGDAGRVAPSPGQQLGIVREVDQVLGQLAAAGAPEAPHAPRHVGREAGARLLAVVAHVDAGLELAGDHARERRPHLAVQGRGLHGLAAILAHQEIAERRRAGQAAHVGGEDPGVAPRAWTRPPPRLDGGGGRREGGEDRAREASRAMDM